MIHPEVKKIAHLTGHTSSIYALAEGFKENFFFSGGSDKIIAEWNLETLRQENFAIKLEAPAYSFVYIKERGIILAGNGTGGIHVIDLEKKKEIKLLQQHTAPVFDLKYAINHHSFYAASADGSVSVSSLETLSHIKTVKLCEQKIRDLSINREQSQMAIACGDSSVRIFDLSSFTEIFSFEAHRLSANAVKYHPDGKHLITGGKDAHLNIWNIADNYRIVQSIPAHNYAIYSIEFSPDNKLFATASRDKTIKIWDARTFELLLRIDKSHFNGHINSVNKLLWSKYKNYLISAGDDRTIMVWEINGKTNGEN